MYNFTESSIYLIISEGPWYIGPVMCIMLLVAVTPIIAGIMARRKFKYWGIPETVRAFYINGEFKFLDKTDQTIAITKKSEYETIVVITPEGVITPVSFTIMFRETDFEFDRPDIAAQNSSPFNQWVKVRTDTSYEINVFRHIYLSRVVIHINKDGTASVEFVFNQGHESRLLFNLIPAYKFSVE